MDDIKLFAKNEKELESLILTIEYKTRTSGYRNGIWLRKMYHVCKENWKTVNNVRNRTAKTRKNQNTRRKGNLQVL